jgi:hypothetical protein
MNLNFVVAGIGDPGRMTMPQAGINDPGYNN